MPRLLVLLLSTFMLLGCVPWWSATQCKGQPKYGGLTEAQRNTKISQLSDDALLDYAACRVVSRHPPGIDFPSVLITSRSPAMATQLLGRITQRDEGLISMEYASLLSEMVKAHPAWLSTDQLSAALSACNRNYQAGHPVCSPFE